MFAESATRNSFSSFECDRKLLAAHSVLQFCLWRESRSGSQRRGMCSFSQNNCWRLVWQRWTASSSLLLFLPLRCNKRTLVSEHSGPVRVRLSDRVTLKFWIKDPFVCREGERGREIAANASFGTWFFKLEAILKKKQEGNQVALKVQPDASYWPFAFVFFLMALICKVQEENVLVFFMLLSHPFTRLSKYIESFPDSGNNQQSGRSIATF